MPTNVFISQSVRSEQMLFEDIVIEALKMYGQDVVYLPREVKISDEVLNEEFASFRAAYTIEMYIANTEGFEGDGNLLSKFGLEIRDQATFIVSRKRFSELVDIQDNALCEDRPREGDLIYLPLSNSLFQIKFVEHEQPFYQISNLPTYELQCELFEYSNEDFSTGIEAIDDFQMYNGTRYAIEVQGGEIGFAYGDEIKQTVDDTVDPPIEIIGRVSGFNETDEAGGFVQRTADLYFDQLYVSDGSRPRLQMGQPLINSTRDHSDWTITKIYDLDDGDEYVFPSDEFADNSTFELESEQIIDFSEINPFGDPRENS